MKTKSRNKSNTIIYTDKEIFESSINRILSKENGSTVIIPHVCNNVNTFGAGFANAVAKKFPIVKENFHLLTQPNLGQNQFISVLQDKQYGHELFIVNMIAQNGLFGPNNPRPLNYAALTFCMHDIKNRAKKIKNKLENSCVEIHAPKFGSGLAGGEWKFISEIINDLWLGIPVYVYELSHRKN